MASLTKERRWILLLDGALLALVLLAGPLATWMIQVVPTCPVALAGYQCAACGSTRCVLALSRLDVVGAFFAHPMLCLLLCYGFVGLLALNLGAFGLGFGKRLFRALVDYRVVIGWALAYALFGLVRNF